MGFFKHFGKSKLKKAVTETKKAIARADKEGFSDAVLGEMEENLTNLSVELAEKRNRTKKEVQEHDDAIAELEQRKAAARKVKADIDDGDETKIPTLEKLLDLIDVSKAKVEKEGQEAEFWTKHLDIIESNFKNASADLKGARQKISQGMAKMEQADIQKAQAEEQKNLSMRANGLSSSMSGLDAALGALDEATTKAEAEAEAAEVMAGNLGSDDSDADVLAAMKSVSGNKSKSLDDRMADL
ncbi:MAG: hypothetical protein DRG78_04490 [Epsilonproteobacteria bacterium]|nr:MAG: hypothetical protein DRG78_04490 [Campylobacterota bacterium]